MKFSYKSLEKKTRKNLNRLFSRGKKFSAKHQYGVLFSMLTLVTVMVGLNEYITRENDRFLAEFNAQPSAVSEHIQYATPEKKEDRNLAGKKSPRKY